MAAAMRSESDKDSLIALPNSCISSLSRSSKRCLFLYVQPALARPVAFKTIYRIAPDTRSGHPGSTCPGKAFRLPLLPTILSAARGVPRIENQGSPRKSICYHDGKPRVATSEMVKLAKQFLGHVIPGVIRPLRILWNEVIGFLFLVFAIGSTPAVVRSFRDLDKPDG